MNRRALVLLTIFVALVAFAVGGLIYSSYGSDEAATAADIGITNQTAAAQTNPSSAVASAVPLTDPLVRPHSPVLGPANARVTIVEFFDPSCEACRAFYPLVKQVMAQYPSEVRLVIRYAPLHPGSEDAVRMLEAARLQGLYVPVLEALLTSQPEWHDGNMEAAWSAAQAAGLDLKRATDVLHSPQINAVLEGDIADLRKGGIKGTPTFFVNGKLLADFGEQQFRDLVRAEVEAVRR